MRDIRHQELLDRLPPEVPAALVVDTAAPLDPQMAQLVERLTR